MSNNVEKEFALETVISNAVQIPGVKVNRDDFLKKTFSKENVVIEDVVNYGPIEAGVRQETISKLATKLILSRTSGSSIASFVAGIPGGWAMAATIPMDVLQFFAVALRLAQELSYLYGAKDLWEDGKIDDERVQNQLLLYCGVMFGVSGAVSGVRVLSTQIAKTTLKKLPQKALTKTFWYPIVKQIGKAIGIKVTKSAVAQGVSKAIPVIGGVISGGLNFASMLPMANRLKDALESASFDYSEEDLNNDIIELESIDVDYEDVDLKTKLKESGKKTTEKLSGLLSVKSTKEKTEHTDNDNKNEENTKKNKPKFTNLFSKKTKEEKNEPEDKVDVIETLKKLSELKDCGIITQEEFEEKKAELLSKI